MFGEQRTVVVGLLLHRSAAHVGVVSGATGHYDRAVRWRVSNDGSHPWFVLATQTSFPTVPMQYPSQFTKGSSLPGEFKPVGVLPIVPSKPVVGVATFAEDFIPGLGSPSGGRGASAVLG